MKKRLSALLLLTPFLLFASMRAYGQINPHPGYIVTNENDTISGTLDLRTSSVNSRQCTFRAMGGEGFQGDSQLVLPAAADVGILSVRGRSRKSHGGRYL